MAERMGPADPGYRVGKLRTGVSLAGVEEWWDKGIKDHKFDLESENSGVPGGVYDATGRPLGTEKKPKNKK